MTLTDEQRRILTTKQGTKITTRIPGLTARVNAALLSAKDKKDMMGGVKG